MIYYSNNRHLRYTCTSQIHVFFQTSILLNLIVVADALVNIFVLYKVSLLSTYSFTNIEPKNHGLFISKLCPTSSEGYTQRRPKVSSTKKNKNPGAQDQTQNPCFKRHYRVAVLGFVHFFHDTGYYILSIQKIHNFIFNLLIAKFY